MARLVNQRSADRYREKEMLKRTNYRIFWFCFFLYILICSVFFTLVALRAWAFLAPMLPVQPAHHPGVAANATHSM